MTHESESTNAQQQPNAAKLGSWWATLPGILTALATLLGAIASFYIAVATHGKPETPGQRDNTTQTQDAPTSKQAEQVQGPSVTQPQQQDDPCKTLPFDDRPISCLGDDK